MSTLELGTLQAELGALAAAQLVGFTLITVNVTFDDQTPEGAEPSSGTVTFTLLQPIANGTTTITCAPLIASLDDTGALSVVLVATDDAGTVPPGVWYGVTEQITGAQPRDYFIQVSATGPNPLVLAPPSTLVWT